MMIQLTIPADVGNAHVKNGTLGTTIKSILDEMRPESAYFTTVNGQRGGYIVVDVKDASEIPKLAEPFFLAFQSEIDFQPVMTPQDLEAALPAIEKAAATYGK
jgi:hypothetical protein